MHRPFNLYGGNMKRRDNIKIDIIAWVVVILVFIAIMFVDKFFFETVTESNLPDWLKWFLLR